MNVFLTLNDKHTHEQINPGIFSSNQLIKLDQVMLFSYFEQKTDPNKKNRIMSDKGLSVFVKKHSI